VTAAWLERVRWNADGLVAAVAQEATTRQVLTLDTAQRSNEQCHLAEAPSASPASAGLPPSRELGR